MRKPFLFVLLLVLLVLTFSVGQGSSLAQSNDITTKKATKQAIVIFVEGLSFADFSKLRIYPHVDKWLTKGMYGALTIRPAGSRTEGNAYLLLGSGGQALYTDRSGVVFQATEVLKSGETAHARMFWLSGKQSGNTAAIIFPAIFRLLADNAEKPFSPRIGLLGTTLAANGLIISAYGNGDYSDVKQRNAALFGIDQQGRIPSGNITARTNRARADYPSGITTNYDYLLDRLRTDKHSAVITVQLSDLSRLYRLRDYMEPNQFERLHGNILSDLDRFIDIILSNRSENQMIVMLSALPNGVAMKEKSLLTPIMLWQQGSGEQLLTSATTRRDGLVSGLDLLPTLLSWLEVPMPPDLAGHVIIGTRVPGQKVEKLLRQVAAIDHIYQNRASVMYAYVMLQIIILSAAALLWLWKKHSLERLRRGIRLALLALLFFPLLFLAEGLLSWAVSPPVVLGVIIMFALGGALIMEQWPFPAVLFTITGSTVGFILLDGFTGAQAMKHSYLGYDPVIGARFYGLGNEYEGVLIGAATLFGASLYQWQNGWNNRLTILVTSLLFAIVLFYMAAPSLGTDAGGFLAGIIGFGVALFRLQEWQFRKKSLLLLAGGLGIGIMLLIAVNLFSSYPLTHVGRVAKDIVSGNWQEVANMVERKIEMNLRLIRVSAWSKVFVISLIVIGLLNLSTDRYLRDLTSRYPSITKGFQGVIAGSIAGLLLNDSGIVTAATAILFFVMPALYYVLGENNEQKYST